jgi:hypothetical protein
MEIAPTAVLAEISFTDENGSQLLTFMASPSTTPRLSKAMASDKMVLPYAARPCGPKL